MPSSSSGIVFGLTATALATVGFLGYQAYGTVPTALTKAHTSAAPAAVASKAPGGKANPNVPPAGSGVGERVVYSVGSDRIWLVGSRNEVTRSFTARPGTVDPAPGVYRVTSRSNSVIGTDGVPIEHVVRFATVNGVAIGFSAAVGDAPAAADSTVRTGGIRESREDGDAMWAFATIGAQVAVIP
ncbi:hypothetical protein [Streptomyces sp. NBC_00588]|uniref:hypothetical protein n=1 Tax=Streptomyces sp. NBC_00588 TaxID=2975784 RepID=UPI002E80BD98|nr:hypothetical protein [Streptomyces sp. NBC_00588]WUB37777.1 hypothetical protein OHN38_23805 [Streptomyces sp. NBC_00588]